jgi:2-keto-4-pentenoate hydratase
MSIDKSVQEIWESHQRGDFYPQAWRGKLNLTDAYRVQLGILDRKVEQGEIQAGWKVGMMSKTMREMLGGNEPVFGYLLESARFQGPQTFAFGDLSSPMVEHEILITMGKDLGPDATPQKARDAISTIAPAFEIIEMRGENVLSDIPLFLIDNIGQRAFVHGNEIPLHDDLDFGSVKAEIRVNNNLIATAIGRDAIDNQLQTVAWLANALRRQGRQLRAGQRIMSGTFIKPTPVTKGDAFETTFSDIGTVSTSFGN